MLGRDVEREILMRMDDKDLLNTCISDRRFYIDICDDEFFHRRLQQKYPDTLKNKPEDMKYKAWYLQIVFYVAKLKEEFNYEYSGGNPKIQLEIFRNGGYQAKNNSLLISAGRGELPLVKYFVEHGANIHYGNDEALRWASVNGHLDIVKYLVEQGVNIHLNDDYVLRLAKLYNQSEVVKYLESLP